MHQHNGSRPNRFFVQCVDWQSSQHELRNLREKVFIYECRQSHASEFDALESHSHHVLITDQSHRPIATGRLSPTGDIGHIAVLIAHRHLGLGRQILARLLKIARNQGFKRVRLSCPLQSCDFFQLHGFSNDGPVYMRDGIPHRKMCIKIPHSRLR